MAKSPNSRQARRQEVREAQEKRRRLYYAGAAIAALALFALFALIRSVAAPKSEDVILSDLTLPTNADGKAWGPVGAPVLVEEFSDFQ